MDTPADLQSQTPKTTKIDNPSPDPRTKPHIAPIQESLHDSFHLTWENLEITVKKTGKQIIHGLSGSLESGKLIAVIGASGCGKTTFLNFLSGYTNDDLQVSGSLKINGKKLENLKLLKRISGYVLQQDILLASLTIEETLRFQAKLKLPPNSNFNEVVDQNLKMLNLENSRHTRIGDELHRGISGGERKRVSIGCELVTDPS